MFEKMMTWVYLHLFNPVERKGECGGFKWKFRRFWLEISTLSGNFKARFTAGVHPYGYLQAGETDENIKGFCETLYMVGMLLTTDQGFVDDIQKAIRKYDKRLASIKPEEDGEEAALAYEKEVQEYLELPKKERKKKAKEINRRFNKTVREVGNE